MYGRAGKDLHYVSLHLPSCPRRSPREGLCSSISIFKFLVACLVIRSQVVTSKQSKLELTQELSSRISEPTTGYIFTPCVGCFTSSGIDTK